MKLFNIKVWLHAINAHLYYYHHTNPPITNTTSKLYYSRYHNNNNNDDDKRTACTKLNYSEASHVFFLQLVFIVNFMNRAYQSYNKRAELDVKEK